MKKALKIIVAVALIAAFACILFACVPTNLEKAKEKMENEGFTVLSASFNYEGIEGAFNATKASFSEGSGTLTAIYFESTSAAKEAYETIVGEENKDKDNAVKQSGRWVYFGTSAGIKAFEG